MAGFLLAVFLGVQLSVPTVLVIRGDERSQRFGWQMFSKGSPATEFTVVLGSGEEVTVTPGDVLARPRGDLPLIELIPPHLCATFNGAVRILWEGDSREC